MKKRKSGGGGGANWMDTYGDMVTLLLCFFVLLYSMSSISEENWKNIVMSFNPNALKTITETSGNEGPNADPNEDDGSGMGQFPTHELTAEEIAQQQQQVEQDLETFFEMMQIYVSEHGLEDSVSLTKGDGLVFVTFNQVVFFNGDSPVLREESKPILETIGTMLTTVKDSVDEVRVLGHTAQGTPGKPNDPVTDRNLSAQRAANTLAHIQMNTELDPAKMVSEGYGQWRPVADNDTEENRQKNRRVELIISGRNIEEEMAEELKQHQTGN